MPDKKGSVKEPEKKRPFIREKVARPPMTKRQVFARIVVYILVGVLAGAAAGASFALVGPLAERYLTPTTEEITIPVVIPTDEEPEPSTAEPTMEAATENQTEEEPSESESETETQEESESTETESIEVESTEAIENVVQSVLDDYNYTVDDLTSMYAALREVVQAADRGIVTVHSVHQELDWFDNPLENTGLYAGVIIAVTEKEYLILTPIEAVENADALSVTFSDDKEVICTVRQTDRMTGMAVVSVDTRNLEEVGNTRAEELPLGNSYITKQGDVLIAIGAPTGVVHSSMYGTVSYILRNVQVPDGVTRVWYVNMAGNADAGTFLINTAGELVGWVTDEYETSAGIAAVRTVSEYKTMLEKLSNGISVPYLGIQGQAVSEAMIENGMPQGIYVTECSLDGPAYTAGIQNGDIIVQVGEQEIKTMSDYQNQVAALRKEDQVTVVVQRKGAEEYIELEYEVIAGAR